MNKREFDLIWGRVGANVDRWIFLLSEFESDYIFKDLNIIAKAALELSYNYNLIDLAIGRVNDPIIVVKLLEDIFFLLRKHEFILPSLDLREDCCWCINKPKVSGYITMANEDKGSSITSSYDYKSHAAEKLGSLITPSNKVKKEVKVNKVYNEQICSNCAYFRPLRSECHRGAPGRRGFPRVSPKSYCRKFR